MRQSGDFVNISITIYHTSSSSSTAYQMSYEQSFGTQLSYVPGSLVYTATPDISSAVVVVMNNGAVSVTTPTVYLSSSINVQFSLVVNGTVTPGATINPSTATLTWDSTPVATTGYQYAR